MSKSRWMQLLVSAVITIIIVQFYIRSAVDRRVSGYDFVDVVTATRDIPQGVILQKSDLKISRVPRNFLQPTAIVAKGADQDFHRLVGKRVLIPLPSDSQVMLAMVADAAIMDIDQKVPLGKRAYPLIVQRTEITRLIQPGTHIDLIANFTVRDKNGNMDNAARTVLQNALVLSAHDQISRQPPSAKDREVESTLFTLALSPVDCERMSVAEKASQGDFRIVIRHPLETDKTMPPAVTTNNL